MYLGDLVTHAQPVFLNKVSHSDRKWLLKLVPVGNQRKSSVLYISFKYFGVIQNPTSIDNLFKCRAISCGSHVRHANKSAKIRHIKSEDVIFKTMTKQ